MAAQAQVENKSPDFTLPADSGSTGKLSDLCGKKTLLKYYPKYDTPGCTRILRISKDSVAKHDKFEAKYEPPFTLVSD